MELPFHASADSAKLPDPTQASQILAEISAAKHYPSPTKDDSGDNPGAVAKYSPFHMAAAAPPPVDAMNGCASPQRPAPPKSVNFELLYAAQYRARLPLRVAIFPHDTTDSIVTTVKNFYGLYSGPSVSKGVSFEDKDGNILIARYENLHHNMVVYVRVIDELCTAPGFPEPRTYQPAPQSMYNGDGYQSQQHAPPQFAQHVSRPASRNSRKRSPSPNSGRGRRSDSVGTNPAVAKKGRSRSTKTRVAGPDMHSDSVNGYSSGDNAPGSASGKAKDQIGNTDISVENIVEGGRRKRAKFESSELPLFAPPQMPAATSNPSVSPARRADAHRHSLPFVQPGQNPFTNPRPLQSPQSYHNGSGYVGMYATPASETRRIHRNSIGYAPATGLAPNMGMMPTPDPTVGSCMSEEDKDVAIQLMRLGEMSNVSHGRTSASTLDDTFSGRADAASSTGATSDAESESDDDEEEEESSSRRQKLDASGAHRKVMPTTEAHFVGPRESAEASGDDADYDDGHAGHGHGTMAAPKLKAAKPRSHSSVSGSGSGKSRASNASSKARSSKSGKSKSKKVSASASGLGPISPASLPAMSRKPSVTSNSNLLGSSAATMAPPTSGGVGAGGDDQPDLSTKPRCQRCRKSKKGCDRQRPCGRCRDAGIPAEQCISEDEGNGRKGRYGRHMGVPIKKDHLHQHYLLSETGSVHSPTSSLAGGDSVASLLPPAPIATAAGAAGGVAGGVAGGDKNKKRKR